MRLKGGGVAIKKKSGEVSLEHSQNLKAASIVGVLGVISIIWFSVNIAYDPPSFWYSFGFRQSALEIPLAWIIALVTAIGYIIYTAYGVDEVRTNLFKINGLKLISIPAAILLSTLEEVLFRQILMNWLYAHGIGIILQIIISGAVFGIGHVSWTFIGGNWKLGLSTIIPTAILGVLLAISFAVGQRNVLPAVVAHILVNLFIEPWLILHAVKEGSGKNKDKNKDKGSAEASV